MGKQPYAAQEILANYESINETLKNQQPKEILRYAIERHDGIAVSFSGAEDVVLVDMASKLKPGIEVFSLDTGRLHAQTYQFIEKIRTHYDIKLSILSPEREELEALTSAKGLFSFYEDGHKECCGIRKVTPLRRKLATLDAWVTGQRKDQSPNTRADVPTVQVDQAFSGRADSLAKYNPLANWTSAEVWMYIRMFDVPFNPLHESGYISIGCEPCTRPTNPSQHEREGRWWWEEATQKECGLHKAD